MPQRMLLRLDLGEDIATDILRQAITDIDTLCQLGSGLQEQYLRNEAERAVARSPERWFRPRDYEAFDAPWAYPMRRGGYIAPIYLSAFEEAVSNYLRDNESTDEITATVERLDYRNPLEIILGLPLITYAVFVAVRDWPQRRRLNKLRVDDYESIVTTRKAVHQHIVDGLASGEYHLTKRQTSELLDGDVADAFKNIGNAQPEIRLLGDDTEG
ncbi:Uncharacterised protein [Mycobacteroides abscessus subsp. massiliense]|nr:Uncharacterised protein [Mycobacteroides abscessus subsp. massiliense]